MSGNWLLQFVAAKPTEIKINPYFPVKKCRITAGLLAAQ